MRFLGSQPEPVRIDRTLPNAPAFPAMRATYLAHIEPLQTLDLALWTTIEVAIPQVGLLGLSTRTGLAAARHPRLQFVAAEPHAPTTTDTNTNAGMIDFGETLRAGWTNHQRHGVS